MLTIHLPLRKVFVDTLSDEDKHCVQCGTEMIAIGTEVIRTEVQYTPAKLERVEYIATTYECPNCKEKVYFDEDMIAETLGMKVFLLTDCLINKQNIDISVYPNGDFDKLIEYIENV